jgi:predicted nucleic acid-binding protein
VIALFDTGVLVDHLTGKPEAAAVLAGHRHGAISVITWVELMGAAPPGLEEATRTFLHRFERLAINEAIADRAVSLRREHATMSLPRALIYATALINAMTFVSVDIPSELEAASNIVVPYARNRPMARQA